MALLPTTQLTLKLGKFVPVAAPRELLDALQSVEVTHSDEGRSGFQLVFRAGRTANDLRESPVVSSDVLKVFTRVRILLTISGNVHVLMDGVITHQQYAPSAQPGGSTFTVTGEDVGYLMDQVEYQLEYPAMDISSRVNLVLSKYSLFGVVPYVVPLTWDMASLAIESVATQQGTDLDFLSSMAEEAWCVFYVMPGPTEGTNVAYFGPRVRAGVPQRALTWNMGASTNLVSIDFEHDATKPVLIGSWFPADPDALPVTTSGTPKQPMSLNPTLAAYLPNIKTKLGPTTEKDYATALGKASEETARSTDAVVTASGEVDAFRYGAVLQARGLVDVRGVGLSYDGTWYVKSVTHSLKKGEYRQKFSLERDGLGALLTKVTV